MRHYGRIWKTKKPFLSIVDAAFFWNGKSGEQVKRRRNGNRKFPMTKDQIKKSILLHPNISFSNCSTLPNNLTI
jgi:hypothetical protein